MQQQQQEKIQSSSAREILKIGELASERISAIFLFLFYLI